MNELSVDPFSEKLAMRIPYWSLWARIQSAPAMTSLVQPIPSSLRTSTETRFAPGAAPARPADAPVAMPATIVPCPRPSPAAFGAAVVRSTLAITFGTDSGSTPESTTAIVGSDDGASVSTLPQSAALPDSYGQSWSDE